MIKIKVEELKFLFQVIVFFVDVEIRDVLEDMGLEDEGVVGVGGEEEEEEEEGRKVEGFEVEED